MPDEKSKNTPPEYTTMKIDPEIFEELGVRDPEQIKLETKIMKETRKLKKELKKDTDNVEKQVELATLYVDGGDYEEAIKMLKTIVSRDNKNFKAYKVLGTAYVLFNHEDEAIREMNRAAELDPDDPEIHSTVGGRRKGARQPARPQRIAR